MRVVCIDAVRDRRWGELVATRGGSLFHSPSWLGALADAYGYRPRAYVMLDAGGRPVAGASFCPIVDLSGARIVCSPFSDFCDPLADLEEEWPALRRSLLAMGQAVTCRWRDYADVGVGGGGDVTRRALWHGIDIDVPLDTLWARVSPSARRAVRKAEREGVRVAALEDEHLEDFVRLHVSLRKRKYGMLAQPRVFFEAIRHRFCAGQGWVPLAAHHRGRIVAVTIYLKWGDTLYYKFNASAPDALGARPNDLLIWEGMRLAHQLGCRQLDLGATNADQPGLVRFKRHYGAAERAISHLRFAPAKADAQAPDGTLLPRVTGLLTDPGVPDELTRSVGAAWYRYFV